jgi:hypothetical protein
MSTSPWEELLSTCDELQAHMERHAPGANPRALQELRAMTFRMRSTSNYANDRLNKIEEWAAMYFSARRWANHQRGAAGVRHEIIGSGLSRIRDEARNRMSQEAKSGQ